MAVAALALHIEGVTEDGEAIPEPSSLEAVMADAINRDGVATLVAAPATVPKAIRVNVTLPSDVLADIDAYAEANGHARPGFSHLRLAGTCRLIYGAPCGRRGSTAAQRVAGRLRDPFP